MPDRDAPSTAPQSPALSPKVAPKTEAELRLEREAQALRQNLLRRKQQARARQARKPEHS